MNKKKIISIISSVHKWDDTRVFKKQALSLSNAGYIVNLYACADFKFKSINNINIFGLPIWKRRKDRLFNRRKIKSYLLNDNSSIIHFHDPELIFIGLYFKFFKSRTVIYDIHENVPLQILDKEDLPKVMKKIISSIYLCLEKITLPLFDAIITAGSDIASYFPERIVINNYPIFSFNNIIKRRDVPNNVIYVGKIQDIYGIHCLCEAINIAKREIPDLTLVLVGDFVNKATKDKILAYDFVEYLGWKSMQEIYQISSECKIGIVNYLPLPNHYALRSNKVFEYMVSCLPVIFPNFEDWKNKIGIFNVGLDVVPNNPKEIAKAIVFLIENPEIAEQMGKNGRKAVEEKYNWAIEEKKLLKLYKDLL